MSFTRDWSESTPAGSDQANTIDDSMRNFKVDISDRLKNMFYGLIAGENSLSQHSQYIQFYEQASVAQPSAGYGRLYCLAVGGKCELHWHDEDGDEIQLTTGGKLNGAVITELTLPTGIAVKADTSDGSDNARLSLCGGGAASDSRGAVINLNGNEHATTPGDLYLSAGSGKHIVLNSQKITAMADPTADQDAATKKYVDDYADAVDAKIPSSLSGGNDSIGEADIGELQLKWGKKTLSAGDNTITLTTEGLTAFTNNCFQVFACGGATSGPNDWNLLTHTISKTAFHIYMNSNTNDNPVRWFAIGR